MSKIRVVPYITSYGELYFCVEKKGWFFWKRVSNFHLCKESAIKRAKLIKEGPTYV